MKDNMTLIVTMNAKKELLKEAVEYAYWLMGEVRKEEGCLQFELLQSTADETVLTVYETWETKALWQNHLKSKHMLEFNPRTKELFNDISVEEFSFILGE